MTAVFAIAAAVAVVATALAITRMNAVHALLYLAVSLLAVAVAIYTLGAPYLAALEVIVYAGAIIVLFIFVSMMLNLGAKAVSLERQWQPGRGWIGPGVLAAILAAELAWMLARGGPTAVVRMPLHTVGPKAVAQTLLGPYVIGVELASMLLLGGLVAAYHLGWSLERKQAELAAAAGEPSGKAKVGAP
ncbi:MAG: NADH-quinone oxidoreductase subunit J [Terriglobales bacterium]